MKEILYWYRTRARPWGACDLISDAQDVRCITTRAGENILFGNAENLFNADKFIHALQKAGIPVIEKPR